MRVHKNASKRFGKSSYMSWIIDPKAPFSPQTKVYSLPAIEYDFWMKMKNNKTGYLRIQSKGFDQAGLNKISCQKRAFWFSERKKKEEEMAKALTEFRNWVCASLVFINILFLVFTITMKLKGPVRYHEFLINYIKL